MAGSLNDTIDDLFRGIVFIILNAITSALWLIFVPWRGCLRLLRRLYARDTEQVKPTVFLFITFFITCLIPIITLVDPGYQPAYPRALIEIDEANRAQQVFENVSKAVEAEHLLVLLLAVILGVTLFDIACRLLGAYLFPSRFYRQVLRDAFAYLAGAQALLLLISYLADIWLGNGMEDRPGASELAFIFLEPFFWRSSADDPLLLVGFHAAVLLVYLLLPLPLVIQLVRRRYAAPGRQPGRPPLSWRQPKPKRRRCAPCAAFGALVALDFATAAAIGTTGLVQWQLTEPARPYAISELRCTIDTSQTSYSALRATLALHVSGTTPLVLDGRALQAMLSVPRPESDWEWLAFMHQYEGSLFFVEDPKAKGLVPGPAADAQILKLSAPHFVAPDGSISTTVFLAPGHDVLVDAVYNLGAEEASFIATKRPSFCSVWDTLIRSHAGSQMMWPAAP